MRTLLAIFGIVLLVALTFEYQYKIAAHHEEKIYDLQLQYKYVLQLHKKIVDLFIEDVINNPEVVQIMSEASRGINRDANRDRLYAKYRKRYKHLESKGILQFHFHLANGDSFLRFHKPGKYGDNLLAIRPTIKAVHETKNSVSAYEIGRLVDGFRYVYPIWQDSEIIGTVECSTAPLSMLEMMRSSLDAKYSMILAKEFLYKKIKPEQLERYFHTSAIHEGYMMHHDVHDERIVPTTIPEHFKTEIYQKMTSKQAFVASHIATPFKAHLMVFVPIHNINGERVGYFFSKRTDTTVMKILYEQLFKLLAAFSALAVIFHLYRKNRRTQYLLEQYKDAVDQSTLVSNECYDISNPDTRAGCRTSSSRTYDPTPCSAHRTG